MSWASFEDFVEMGGFALYVWGSYAMVLVAALWEWALLAHRRRRALDDAREQLAMSESTP